MRFYTILSVRGIEDVVAEVKILQADMHLGNKSL
jgi:hypothetical protein